MQFRGRYTVPVLALALSLVATLGAQAQSDVDIEKFTNGQNADVAPGPSVTAGSTVNWTYVVTNTGSRPLTNITVTDDQGEVVTCPATTLDAGLSFICTASGTAVLGQYANIGTVTATRPDTTDVNDSDPSHYFGQPAPSVSIEKRTNGFDADTPPGPSVPAGSTVSWEYEITNIGSDDLIDIVVADDQGVVVSCPGTTLSAGASMTCTGSGIAQPGQYSNIGSVTATLFTTEDGVAASDPSHYYGQTLSLIKRTNGVDTATPPGPVVAPGSIVNWTYEVTNPGPATVTGLTVTDDQGVIVSCAQTTLAAGESVTCTASGAAVAGQYTNIGTAEATLPAGGVVTVSDSSFYFANEIRIEKATNGVDADVAPGPSINTGDPVNWTYDVTNFGADTLTDVAVTDDQGVTVTCPGTTLAPGASMTCTAAGVAVAGQYANVGTVDATSPTLGAISASDASHYFGQNVSLDFGDAPDPTYQSLFASNGARHILGSGVFLGACVDAEADALAGTAADGDDLATGTPFGTCAVAGDDEDGVDFTTPIRVGLQSNVDVVASEPCTLSAWIDFTADGDFGEPEDDLFPGGTPLVAGNNSLSFTVPANAIAGQTYARFRCTTAGSVGFTGEAADGEVEDYRVTIIVPVPSVTATKSDALFVDVDGDTLAEPGDTLRYTIVITNSGTGDATDVVFTDTPDANTALVTGSVTTSSGSIATGNGGGDTSVTVNAGTIAAAGGSATITFDVLIDDPLPPGVTTVANQGTVAGTNFANVPTDDPAVAGGSDPTVTTLTVPPSVAATKSDSLVVDVDNDGLAEPGDTLLYTIVITNSGTGDATGVALNDTPDANTTLVAGSVTTSSGSVVTGNTAGDSSVAVNIGTLAGAGGSATVTFRVVVDNPLAAGVTSVSNQGTVSGTNFANVPTDDPAAGGTTDPTVTAVTLTPVVTATKSDALQVDVDNDGLAEPGDTLRYTIVVTNSGTGDATSVVFTDTPDVNTALVTGSVTTSSGSVATGNGGGDSSVTVNVGTIAAYGAAATITFDVVIDDPLAAGVTSVSNQGTVSGGNIENALTDDPAVGGATDSTVTPVTLTPVVTATKSDALQVDVDNDGLAEPGDTLRYTIVVTNSGTADATSVVFTDTPDTNTALVTGSVTTSSGSVATGNGGGDSSVTVNVGTIAAYGAAATIVFDVVIDDPLTAGVTSVSNQGTVSGGNIANALTDDPAAGGTTDPTVTPLTLTPVVTATKSDALQVDVDNDGLAEPGDTVRYTIVVTNSGTADATSVVFTDTPDTNTALVTGSVTTSSGSVATGNGGGDTSVTVNVGTIAAYGATATITFDVVIDDPLTAGVTSVSNQGTVSGGNFANTLTDDPAAGGTTDRTVTPLTLTPVVAATKTDALQVDVDNDGLAEPGDTVRYTIVVTNSGTGDATSVVFTDTPDTNTALVTGSVTTSSGSVATGNGGGDSSVTVNVGTIAAYGAAATITFDVVIDDPLTAGVTSVSNQGTVSGGNIANTLTDDPAAGGTTDPTITPLTLTPVVTATKTAALQGDVDGDGLAEPGDTLRYTITISNSGNGDALAVMFNDTPDANTDLIVGSVTTSGGLVTSGNTAGDDTVAVSAGTLPAGGSVTIVFDVRIDNPLPSNVFQVVNSGTVTGSNIPSTQTDDPSLAGSADATAFAVGGAPIPTVELWGLLAMLALFAVLGMRRIVAG